MKQSGSHQAIKRLTPLVAAWVVGKLLEEPRVRGALQEVDSRAYVQKRNAARAVRRASRNAASKPAWLIAGAGAIAIGIALVAKATRK